MSRPEKMTNRIFLNAHRTATPLLIGLVAWLACLPAAAASLGEISLQTHIGQPLRATVSMPSETGEDIPSECFSVVPQSGSDIPSLSARGITLNHDGQHRRLIISSRSAIHEPIVMLVLRLGCGHSLQKEYILMPDPPPSVSDIPPSDSPTVNTASALVPTTAPRSKKAGKPRRSEAANNEPATVAANPIAALGIKGNDRVWLGPEPSQLGAGELAVAPRSELGEMEERLLKLETSLNSLNREVDALGAALSVTAEQAALSKKLRAAQGGQAPGGAETPSRDTSAGSSLGNWLELLLSALAGGAITSGIAHWASRRRSRLAEPVIKRDYRGR